MDEFDEPKAEEAASQPRRGGGRGRLLAMLRAVLILALLGLFLYAVWLGNWYGLVAWILTVLVMLDTSVNVLFGQFDEPGSRRYGWILWIASVFLGTLGVQMVTKEGKVKPYRPAGPLASLFARLGAPGMTVIENGMSVVFERSGKFTRVHGPGVAFIRRFQRGAYVVALRRQLRSRPVQKIMTRDGLSFDLARLDVMFEVASDFDPQRGEHSFSEQAVLNLAYRGGFLYDRGKDIEWGERVAGVVEYLLRQVAANYPLENIARLKRGSARQRFMSEVEEQAQPALQQIGVRLIGIDLGQVIVPKELEDLLTLDIKQQVDLGWAKTQREAIVSVAGGLAEATDEIREELRKGEVSREAAQMLLLSLTGILQQISSQFLRLAAPYRGAPEVQRLLATGGEKTPEDEQR